MVMLRYILLIVAYFTNLRVRVPSNTYFCIDKISSYFSIFTSRGMNGHESFR